MGPRLLPYLAAALLLGGVLTGVYLKGHADGSAHKQAAWNKDTERRIEAQKLADEARQKYLDKLTKDQREHNIEVSNAHQQAIDALRADLVRARAAVRAAGGLRIPAAVCAGATQGSPTAGGDGRHDGDTAGTVALPERITADLLDLVAEADRVTEVARACQDWVHRHRLYGADSGRPEP